MESQLTKQAARLHDQGLGLKEKDEVIRSKDQEFCRMGSRLDKMGRLLEEMLALMKSFAINGTVPGGSGVASGASGGGGHDGNSDHQVTVTTSTLDRIPIILEKETMAGIWNLWFNRSFGEELGRVSADKVKGTTKAMRSKMVSCVSFVSLFLKEDCEDLGTSSLKVMAQRGSEALVGALELINEKRSPINNMPKKNLTMDAPCSSFNKAARAVQKYLIENGSTNCVPTGFGVEHPGVQSKDIQIQSVIKCLKKDHPLKKQWLE